MREVLSDCIFFNMNSHANGQGIILINNCQNLPPGKF